MTICVTRAIVIEMQDIVISIRFTKDGMEWITKRSSLLFFFFLVIRWPSFNLIYRAGWFVNSNPTQHSRCRLRRSAAKGSSYLEGEEAGAQATDAVHHAQVGAVPQRFQLAPVQPLRRRQRALLRTRSLSPAHDHTIPRNIISIETFIFFLIISNFPVIITC